MKKIFSLFIVAIIFNSCSSTSKLVKNNWIENYKKKAFYECLKYSYNNDTIFKLIENEDYLFPYEAISFSSLDELKKLSLNVSINAKEPIYKYDGYNNQKLFLDNCLNFYESKELNKIATSEYYQFLKEENSYNKYLETIKKND
jgi:hypothetical protein